ncbi:MAG: hypothetical protein JNK05_35385 [Myxococcales bacterium]|nr:hypothetical protein [Myxococcales bacterium]
MYAVHRLEHCLHSRAALLCALLSSAAFAAGCSRPSEPVATQANAQREQGTLAADGVRSIARGALAALSAESRAAVTRSPVPVLLFGDAAAASASTVTAGPSWYAISARVGERTLSLHVVREEPSPSGAAPEGHSERVRGAPAMFLYNEGVRSVTWSERGATYALEVECGRPFEDEACTHRTFVMGLAESLVRASDAEPASTAPATDPSALTQGGAR